MPAVAPGTEVVVMASGTMEAVTVTGTALEGEPVVEVSPE